MKANVVHQQEVSFKDLGGGVKRRVLAHNEQMMIVEILFEEGAQGALHSHPHSQCTYVRSGRFRFTIDGEDVVVAQGDTIAFPSGIPHATLCLEAGALLDVFTPMREDFLASINQ